ncbi:flavin reductase family protein [Hoeflea poritis]|uniref:Flavin reductase family protein n=1 Tax=Hoeflea poritis TaxID=2993659 RepID=A0ABT4VX64_9HYPH|nr:flavin reductase family protein [Hoeflea poritis]MDA4848632.1 flavin reductase family protein [Hoeflea poritis]
MDVTNYRRALGSFATGVTVATVFDDMGEPWGVTANSFTSVSLEPPVISVCIARNGRAHPVFAACSRFGINILAADQQALAMHFAGKTENRFTGTPWEAEPHGAPRLPGTAAWLDCTVKSRIDAGDHEILLGLVQRYDHTPHPPLAYCRGRFFAAA